MELKYGVHLRSSIFVNLLSSMLKNEMTPLFKDFSYSGPITEVLRLEEFKFS